MTRKEALATLYTFWEAFFRLAGSFPEMDAPAVRALEDERLDIASDAYHALLRLTPVIHGKAPRHGSSYLCDVCHARYANGVLVESEGVGMCTACWNSFEKLYRHQEVPACQ